MKSKTDFPGKYFVFMRDDFAIFSPYVRIFFFLMIITVYFFYKEMKQHLKKQEQ